MLLFAEFTDEERSGWFIGIGRAMMTRASLFRETKGVAVEMVNRVYDLPPFSGTFSVEISGVIEMSRNVLLFN